MIYRVHVRWRGMACVCHPRLDTLIDFVTAASDDQRKRGGFVFTGTVGVSHAFLPWEKGGF